MGKAMPKMTISLQYKAVTITPRVSLENIRTILEIGKNLSLLSNIG
jgi:hypothetical protein